MAKRRLTGATRGIAYGELTSVPTTFDGTATGANALKFLDNAYSASSDMTADEIDTTAFGDYPYGTSEPGFIKFGIDIQMRHQVDGGLLADDLEFMESHALTRTPFWIAILDDRKSATPNGILLSVVATKATNSGEFSGAQDHSYSLTHSSSSLRPTRIVGGDLETVAP